MISYFEVFGGGYDFIETMDMQMAGAGDFPEIWRRQSKIILNEAAVKAMDLKIPLEKQLFIWYQADNRRNKRFSF